ncbi:MAG TPA: pyridoxal-phosphate dependent enzyme [Candidatus Methylomirabilis sp.]|nr:pyridoxal-phosphate dependent enzyme [Candidatus Methylomirabilis sp.]
MKFRYICSECGLDFPIDPKLMVCPQCSLAQVADQPLRGVLEVELRGEVPASWEISWLLPVEAQYFPPIPVGGTPLWAPQRLRRELDFPGLYIKDDGLNPTCSLKDRASFLVSAFAAKFGIQEIVLASSGNAGSSMAGVGAAAGQKVTLFLPKAAPKAKLIQALQYGAKVFRVGGSYDDAYDLSLAYTAKFGGLSRNTAYNPMTIEGKKTVSLELFRQLGQGPDYVFVSAGDGCILSGVYKGFRDLCSLGLMDRPPVVFAVQAEGSAALARAFDSGVFLRAASHTVADSISVDVPRNGFHALRQLREHGGQVVRVSDQQILAAQAHLSRSAGLFTEPAGAAAFAGFLKARPRLHEEDVVVVLATGNGLKDIAAAGRSVQIPEKVITCLDEVNGG